MKGVLLALAFLLELAMLAAAGWWGFTLDAGWPVRVLAGIGVPLLLAVVWGVFCSPRAGVALPVPAKAAVQAACFLVAGRCSPWQDGRDWARCWWRSSRSTRPCSPSPTTTRSDPSRLSPTPAPNRGGRAGTGPVGIVAGVVPAGAVFRQDLRVGRRLWPDRPVRSYPSPVTDGDERPAESAESRDEQPAAVNGEPEGAPPAPPTDESAAPRPARSPPPGRCPGPPGSPAQPPPGPTPPGPPRSPPPGASRIPTPGPPRIPTPGPPWRAPGLASSPPRLRRRGSPLRPP